MAQDGAYSPHESHAPSECPTEYYYQHQTDKFDVYHYYVDTYPDFPVKLYDPLAIPRLPAMPSSQYPLICPQRMVELLRIKEERRGFTGQPLKVRKNFYLLNIAHGSRVFQTSNH